MNKIVAESRRKAKEDAKRPSIFNPNSYKTPTGNYDATNLQSFLPTVYQAKRNFERLLTELESPKVNVSTYETFEELRQQNRVEPTKLLRKDAFRTKMWLRENTGKLDTGNSEYERMKRALDEEDTQCLLVSRTEELVPDSAIRTTKRNIEAVIDAIDSLLELIPADEQVAAKAVADTKALPELRLPLNDRYQRQAQGAPKKAPETPAPEAAEASETSDA